MENVATREHEVGGRATALATTLSVLVAWFLVAVWMSMHGVIRGAPDRPPIGLGLSLLVPLSVFALDARLRGPLFEGMRRLDVASLAALQTFRIGGVFFIIAWLGGTLPAGFALGAGIGDIAIAIAAPFVAAAVAARRPGHRALAITWNVLGVADLVNALFLGVTQSASPSLGFLAGSLTTDAVTRYPLSLIPTFFVPLALMMHATSLYRLISSPRH
jgi:hypothetical protein